MKNKLLVGLAIFLTSFFGAANAQTQEVQPGVARISLIHGDVSTQRGDSGDWVAGALNAPVVAGDRVSTALRSRLELQLDFANFLRLDERAEAKIADLTRTHIQVQVSQGLVEYTVLKDSEADVEIDTPNVAIHPLGPGRYRIQITSDDLTEVTVREGEVEITTPQGSTRVGKGQMITVRGTDSPEYQVADAPRSDSWDNWAKDRDHQVQDAQSWNHANRYYTGVNDLDAYGHWDYVPGYGSVWVPTVGAGWAPYRDGRWVWEPYWGWTWVSYEPWGWAPYHYGRWFINAGYWCWWPGPIHRGYRPMWGPAFVSFFGFSGRHFSVGVGFGFGSIGWLPIGPGDYYYPWWGRHGRSINVVNVTNITNITNINGVRPMDPLWNGRGRGHSNLNGVLTNRHLQDGVTAMPAERFGREGVPRNFERVNAAEFRQGQMVAGAVPVVPTRESLRPVDREANPASVPTRANRPERFFTRSSPTYRPEPFQAQADQVQEVLRQHQGNVRPGRGEAMAPANAPNQTAPGNRAAQPETPNTIRRGLGGAATANTPNVPARPTRQEPPNAASPGWQRFGGERAAPAQQPQVPQRPRIESTGPQRQQPEVPARNNARPEANAQGGWQRFSTPERQQNQGNVPPRPRIQDQGNRPTQAAPSERPGWQRFTPSQQQQRPSPSGPPGNMGRQAPQQSPRTTSRPPLNLRRPIVTPRSSPRPGGAGGGRVRPQQSSPRDGGGRGSSRPSKGPSRPNRGH